MDLLEEDDNIFTFNVQYDDRGDRKNYDESHAIVVDKDRKRIEPFKKLPVLVEDTDIDVGDLIIHNYANKTPVGTLKLGTINLTDLPNEEKDISDHQESCGQPENEGENESYVDNVFGDSTKNAKEEPSTVINLSILNENNNSNEGQSHHRIDDLVELDSSYVTSSDDSPDTTQKNLTINPPSGQLLGGNAESISFDLSLTENDCDFHQTSYLSKGLLARHLPAPRFVAHQMALSISPERYVPKARPKSNRYSVSSSSPSEDGSQFELWAARKKTFNPRRARTKVCIGLLVAVLIVIILGIIIVPIVWVTSLSGNVISDPFAMNATIYNSTTIYNNSTAIYNNSTTIYNNSTTIYNSTTAFDVMDSDATTIGLDDVTTALQYTTFESNDVTSVRHSLNDVTSTIDDITSVTSVRNIMPDFTSVPQEVVSVASSSDGFETTDGTMAP